jgi:hypothetical protein
MEALEQEDDEEVQDIDQDDEEIVTIPKDWCEKIADCMQTNGLPEDLLSIPVVIKSGQSDVWVETKEDGLGYAKKINRGKWGPTLVKKDLVDLRKMGEQFWKRLKKGK